MRPRDLIGFAAQAAASHRLRTLLLVLAMAVGVAAVVMLTALGEGARRYVVDEFSAIGTNLLIVLPGRSQTGGFNPGNAVTNTPRDLTVDDAAALRRAPAVRLVAPLAVGSSEISVAGRLRELMVVGSSAEFLEVRRLKLARGRFLAEADWRRGANEVVLGARIEKELFDRDSAVGRLVRIGERRFRVVGVLAASGQGLGMNTDELAIVPVALAQAMFNSNTLFRIMVEANSRGRIAAASGQVEEILRSRHDGEADVTVITQDAVLATFDRLLGALTLGVAGIAAISLAVAGILVMNVMLVTVSQRTAEIGLLKALGASRRTIRRIFLIEAGLLSLAGATLGYLLGLAGAALIRQVFPAFPADPPAWAILAALGTALASGIVFSLLPARRAAALNPVAALAGRR